MGQDISLLSYKLQLHQNTENTISLEVNKFYSANISFQLATATYKLAIHVEEKLAKSAESIQVYRNDE